MAKYHVIVGNLGTVIDTDSIGSACGAYSTYVDMSKAGFGRAAGEPVSMFMDDELQFEYVPEGYEPE